MEPTVLTGYTLHIPELRGQGQEVTVIIRELTEADIPSLRDVAIKIFRDTFTHLNTPENLDALLNRDYNTESFKKEFNEPGSKYFFLSAGDTSPGYLRLRNNPEVDHFLGTNTTEIHRIYVDPVYHGKKVGDQLMQFSIDTAV